MRLLPTLLMTMGLTAPLPAQEAPDLSAITVRSAAGDTALSDLVASSPAILHFWATWCVPCREELPEVQAFAAELVDRERTDRLVVISVDRAEFDVVATFLSEDLGIDLATTQDPSGAVGIAFALFGYPSTVLLDSEGAIVQRFPGAIQWTAPEMQARLLEHLDAD